MTSVGKKFALNIAAKGRALKPTFPVKKIGRSRDELDVEGYGGRKKSHDTLSANIGVGTPLYRASKSSSMGSVHSQAHDAPMDHDQIVMLTHYVRSLSDALGCLKSVLCEGGSMSADDLRVAAHDKLGEVLCIMKEILQKYPMLHTTDLLATAAMLITKIKSSHYEDVSHDAGNLLYMIDQLSLAFSTSVSDFLMGDIDNFPTIGKTKSYDNLASEDLDDQPPSPEKNAQDCDDIDGVLQRLEGHSGVDRALLQAKLWAKYVKEIITYVEKKNALENEYSKSLTKLANGLRNSVVKETYLPMQAIFCTAFDQDVDFSAASQATCTIIQSMKFVEPLNNRRLEHEKTRKHLKDTWAKELKRMHEAVTNLQKAKANYIKCQQDRDKARDATQKADTDNQSQGTAAQAKKLDNKRKLEEEAIYKAAEAETTYKACVAEANYRQKALEKVKCKVLAEVRDLLYHSDQVMKQVTVVYFQLLHTLSAPKPIQFQTLCEASEQYDPGSQYVEYVKRIHVPSDLISTPEPFVFEIYVPEHKLHDVRKPSSHSSGSSNEAHLHMDGSPMAGRDMKAHGGLKAPGEEDTDSISDSSRSQESSPTASPYQNRHPPLAGSHSLSKLGEGIRERLDPRLGMVAEQVCMTFRGVELSPAARTHLFKKLRTLSRCRLCETYVLFQGAECARCGLSTHKKCLESLHWECGHKSVRRRMTTFGVDFSEHVIETHSEIPRLVCKCTQEIDERGLDVKGIYRVSGVKSKVEALCQEFEMDESNVDLSGHHPNVIANVLKLYLRQLPEPIMSFGIYPEFITLAKLEQLHGGGQGPPSADILQKLTSLVRDLPQPQFRTCGHLMHHLKRVTEAQEMNQMNAYNLGVVFGPTLLRQSEDAVSLDSLLDTPCQTRMVELLIVCADSIFGPVELFMPITPNQEQDLAQPITDETDLMGEEPDCSSTSQETTEGGASTTDGGAGHVEGETGPVEGGANLPGGGANTPGGGANLSGAGANTPGSEATKTPESAKRSVPEITREHVSIDLNLPVPVAPSSPTPTLLEIATGQTSPKTADQPSLPLTASVPDEVLTAAHHVQAEDLPDPDLPDDSSSRSITLQYKNLSPPQKDSPRPAQKDSSPLRPALSSGVSPMGHQALSPALSSGSETSGVQSDGSGRPRKKILAAHVLKSRDNSPTDSTKPALSKPKPYTPPQHRRLCKNGVGGLLERPTTPDPYMGESDDSLEGSLEDLTCMSLPARLSSLQTTQPLLPQPLQSKFYTHTPLTVSLSKSTFYTGPHAPSAPMQVGLNMNNNSSHDTDHIYPVKSPGATSTFYTPSARITRRVSHDLSFGHTPSGHMTDQYSSTGHMTDQYASTGHLGHYADQVRRSSFSPSEPAAAAAGSPSLTRALVPRDELQEPKYV